MAPKLKICIMLHNSINFYYYFFQELFIFHQLFYCSRFAQKRISKLTEFKRMEKLKTWILLSIYLQMSERKSEVQLTNYESQKLFSKFLDYSTNIGFKMKFKKSKEIKSA